MCIYKPWCNAVCHAVHAVRHMVHLSLTYDHRLVDGADAGRFLQEVKKRLEAGQFEV